MQLLRQIEQHALALRDVAPDALGMPIDEAAPAIELPFERPLFAPPHKPRIDARPVMNGDEGVATDALFDQVHVDKTELRARIRRMLHARTQVSLGELLDTHPLEKGLAELVAYMSLASDDTKALIDDVRTQTFVWTDPSRGARQATLPLIIFTR
jgi:hypothetical protein